MSDDCPRCGATVSDVHQDGCTYQIEAMEAAIRKLPPKQPTTLDRMRDAAYAEMSRIETGQLVRIIAGEIEQPMPSQMTKRDDFFGIVRLIDRIMTDAIVLERLAK